MTRTTPGKSGNPSQKSEARVSSPSLSTSPGTGGQVGSSSTAEPTSAPAGRIVVTSFGIFAAHVFWLLLGPATLTVLLIGIFLAHSGSFTIRDAAVGLVVAGMLVCRWIDQRSGQSTTSTGETATGEDFRRYMLRVPLAALGIWGVVKLLGSLLG